jgi:hypothetical protein
LQSPRSRNESKPNNYLKKVKREADKIIRIDSLYEDEQNELRDLLKQREEMWNSTLRECSFDNGPNVDWTGCESQEIDDELRRRGWIMVREKSHSSLGAYDTFCRICSSCCGSGCFQIAFSFFILCVFGGNYFLDFRMNKLNEADSRGLTQDCVLETCKYPQTCRWNESCMEVQMKKSMDAKMHEGTEIKAVEDADSIQN